MSQHRGPQVALKFLHEFGGFVAFLEPRGGREKIAGIRQSVGPDRSQVWKSEWGAVIFAHVAAHRSSGEFNPEFDAAGDHCKLSRPYVKKSEFGGKPQTAALGDDQNLAVGVEEYPLHGAVGPVNVDCRPGRTFGGTAASDCEQTGDEIGWIRGQRERVPSQAIGRRSAVGAAER